MLKSKILIVAVFFVVCTCFLSSAMELDQLEWKVKVGDSSTFELVKFFEKTDPDGDGDINTNTFLVTDENGNQVNITWRVGSKVKYVITQLNDSGAYLKRTYDGKITEQEARTTQVVQKTVDNSTYWEEYAQSISTPTRNASVNDITVVVEELFVIPPLNNTLLQILKFNWKTGWLTEQYQRLSNATSIIGEAQFSTVSSSVPGFDFPILLSGFMVLTIFLRTFHLQRRM
jgi:hypothetical protein